MCVNFKTIARCTSTVFLLLFFGSTAHAQLCGEYGMKITVAGQSGKAVEGVGVQFKPNLIKKRRTLARDPIDARIYRVLILEGDIVKGSYELRVSAPGFKTHSRRVEFPHCKRQSVEVRLLQTARVRGL